MTKHAGVTTSTGPPVWGTVPRPSAQRSRRFVAALARQWWTMSQTRGAGAGVVSGRLGNVAGGARAWVWA